MPMPSTYLAQKRLCSIPNTANKTKRKMVVWVGLCELYTVCMSQKEGYKIPVFAHEPSQVFLMQFPVSILKGEAMTCPIPLSYSAIILSCFLGWRAEA